MGLQKRLLTAGLGVLLLVLPLSTGIRAAVIEFQDQTDVQVWKGNSAIGPWKDVIGYSFFETSKATYDTESQVLTFHTNWGGPNKNFFGILTADLFLDADMDGSWDYAVGLGKGRQGRVYDLSSSGYLTSQQIFAPFGIAYGGRYDQGNPSPVPVRATGPEIATVVGLVIWSNNGNGWQVSIDLGQLSDYLDPDFGFAFLWGTATCGNDTILGVYAPTGVVPLPPGVWLLGTGLAGLGLWARWRRRSGAG